MSYEISNMIDDHKTALGYPVITLYVTDDQIEKLIRSAIRKCSYKACPTHLVTLSAGTGVVDLSAYNVDAVKFVYSADVVSSGGCSGSCDICQKLCTYRGTGDLMTERSRIYDTLANNYSRAEIENFTISDWRLDGNLLYLDNYSGMITIEYIKKDIEFSDLDSGWRSWVERYSLALVKITEGRIRSKFKISSGPFEIESDELVSEGNSDLQELETQLNENIGYWNILT